MSFQAQIGSFGAKTVKRLHGIRRGVMIKLFGAVILDTPVLTGRLRANWKYSEGEPNRQALPDEDKSGSATIAKMQAGASASMGDVPVFLTNSLPYARRIEFEGWSRVKAPQGMMRRNVVRFGRLISIQAARERK